MAILEVLRRAGDWKGVNEHVVLLSKRRAQLKQATAAMVKEAMTYVDQAPTLAVKTELIETLNTVTSGKIFVEVEKARLTRALARIKEDAGKPEEAADIMQEVAVETYGALSKREKVFFIEEQVRLCLDKNDHVRAQILSRKINPRSFDEIVKSEKKAALEAARKAGEDVRQMDLDAAAAMSAEEREKERLAKNANVEHAEGYYEATDPSIPQVEQLRLNYYRLMIRYHAHADDYLEMCRCYQNVMECDGIKDDAAKCTAALKKVVWYVTLAANEPMQQSLLHSISKDTRLIDLPLHKQLTKQFTTKEIIHWDTLERAFAAEMAAETEIFGGEDGEQRRKDLRQRVIEHNLLVIGAILLVVLVLGAIAYAAKTKGLHSNPQIPWGYRPSTPPAGATGGATDRKRKSVDEVSVLVTTTPRGSNYLGPGAPTNEGGIHLGGAENVRVSTALPDVAEAPAGAETGSTDIEANSN